MSEQTECPVCGKVGYSFLHSCSGVRQPHPNIIPSVAPKEDKP